MNRYFMITCIQVHDWAKQLFGLIAKASRFTHVKQMFALPMRWLPKWQEAVHVEPCPPEKVEPIRYELRHFGMI